MGKILLLVSILGFTKLALAQTNPSSIVAPDGVNVPSATAASSANPTLTSTATVTPITPSSLLSFSGDFRYRFQFETQAPSAERRAQRIQARFAINAQVQEDLKVSFRLMTGSSANSGNQTLGDSNSPGMPRRNFGLDLAYLDYSAAAALNILMGKMPQPFFFAGKNQIILDRDITPEGIALKTNYKIDDSFTVFGNLGSFIIRENYDTVFGEDKTDNMLNDYQLGLTYKLDEKWSFTFGAGLFAYTAVKDAAPATLSTGGKANGNTLDLSSNYPTNFDIQQYSFEIKNKAENVETNLFAEILENTDADNLNKASIYGIILGYKAWTLVFSQEDVEKDSTLALFTDSDFAGAQTDSKGSVTSINYKFNKKVQATYSVYKNQNGLSTGALKYDRTHLDLQVSF